MATTALVTGGAKRLGAASCRALHRAGFDVLVHYHQSHETAQQLVFELNQQRADSATACCADLTNPSAVRQLAADALDWKGKGSLDLLVNNASRFYPTPIDEANDDDWNQLIGTNLRAPFLLSQALAPALRQSQGNIINMVDIYAEKPLLNHPLYSIAKAGLAMLTKSLARELAPDVRVNGIAPGVILPPQADPERAEALLKTVPLARSGTPNDISDTLLWLASRANYITGHVIPVDGGRSLGFNGA